MKTNVRKILMAVLAVIAAVCVFFALVPLSGTSSLTANATDYHKGIFSNSTDSEAHDGSFTIPLNTVVSEALKAEGNSINVSNSENSGSSTSYSVSTGENSTITVGSSSTPSVTFLTITYETENDSSTKTATSVTISSQSNLNKFYLTDDINYNLTISYGSATDTSVGEVYLCLNGKVITGTGSGSVITVGSNSSGSVAFKLYDCQTAVNYLKESSTSDVYEKCSEICNRSDYATISGGVITGGNTTSGGGVYVGSSGTFYMYGGTIAGNSASNYGGGVYARGAIIMTGGSIGAQNAPNTAGINGGGLYIGTANSSNSLTGGYIQYNVANGFGSGSTDGAYGGGGVYIPESQYLTLAGVTISNNSAPNGGGVYVSTSDASLTLSGSVISDNTATSYGGGVYVNSTGQVTMNSGTISGNKAAYGGGVAVNQGSFTMGTNGGSTSSSTESSSPAISGNTATSCGGGVYVYGSSTSDTSSTSYGTFTMYSGTISGNTATTYGGGVYIAINGQFTMSGGTIGCTCSSCYSSDSYTYTCSNNTSCTCANTVSSGSGGGVAVGNSETTDNGIFTMSGGTVSGNTASNAAGGVYVGTVGTFTMNDGSSITGNTATSYGGGVYVSGYNTSMFTMNGGVISGNKTTSTSSSAGGGGLYLNTQSSFTMTTGEISNNSANRGGGVYVANNATFTMCGGTISGNSASSNGGGVFVTQTSSREDDSFTMCGGTIASNTASYGGGVFVNSNTTFTMSGGTISTNTASSSSGAGGGVYVGQSGAFTMSDGTISCNKATSGHGGGVYVGTGGAFTMNGGTIAGNSATSNGGGVYVNRSTSSDDTTVTVTRGTFTMTAGSITGNTATGVGGGVYVIGYFYLGTENTDSTYSGTGVISGNSASGSSGGGGVYVGSYGRFYMYSGTIGCVCEECETCSSSGTSTCGNNANGSSNGGGVTLYGSSDTTDTTDATAVFEMYGGTIAGNSASSNGGGVYVASYAEFTMSGGSITGNTASSSGNGYGVYVYASSGTATFTMNGGTIEGHTTSDSSVTGVYVNTNGSFTMTGGYLGDILYKTTTDTYNPVVTITGGYFNSYAYYGSTSSSKNSDTAYLIETYVDTTNGYILIDLEAYGINSGEKLDDAYKCGYDWAVYATNSLTPDPINYTYNADTGYTKDFITTESTPSSGGSYIGYKWYYVHDDTETEITSTNTSDLPKDAGSYTIIARGVKKTDDGISVDVITYTVNITPKEISVSWEIKQSEGTPLTADTDGNYSTTYNGSAWTVTATTTGISVSGSTEEVTLTISYTGVPFVDACVVTGSGTSESSNTVSLTNAYTYTITATISSENASNYTLSNGGKVTFIIKQYVIDGITVTVSGSYFTSTKLGDVEYSISDNTGVGNDGTIAGDIVWTDGDSANLTTSGCYEYTWTPTCTEGSYNYINYASVTKSTTITVEEVKVTEIIVCGDYSKSYTALQTLDIENMTVTAIYNDGSSDTLSFLSGDVTDGYTVQLCNNENENDLTLHWANEDCGVCDSCESCGNGKVCFIVSYGGAKSDPISVTVQQIEVEAEVTVYGTYVSGTEIFDSSANKSNIYYHVVTKVGGEEIDLEGTLTWAEKSLSSTQESYCWKWTPEDTDYAVDYGCASINVISGSVSKIEISAWPTNKCYTALDTLNYEDLTIKVYYDSCGTCGSESECSGHDIEEDTNYAVTIEANDDPTDLTLHYGTDGWVEVTVTYGGAEATYCVYVKQIEVTAPKASSHTYDGSVHTGVSLDSLSEYGLISGTDYTVSDNTATNAGDYTTIIELSNSDYKWSDTTTTNDDGNATINWTIEKQMINVELTLSDTYFTSTTLGSIAEAINAALSAETVDNDNPITISIKTNDDSTIKGTFYWLDSEGKIIEDASSLTLCKDDNCYSWIFIPTDSNYAIYEGCIEISADEVKVVNVTVKYNPFNTEYTALDTFSSEGLVVTLEYNDKTTVDIINFSGDDWSITVCGATEDDDGNVILHYVNGGTVTVTVTYNGSDFDSSESNEGSSSATFTITVNQKEVSPKVASNLTYDGTEQTGVTIDGLTAGADYEILDDSSVSGANAGNYTAVIRLINTDYVWKDYKDETDSGITNCGDIVIVEWSIAKAKVTVEVEIHGTFVAGTKLSELEQGTDYTVTVSPSVSGNLTWDEDVTLSDGENTGIGFTWTPVSSNYAEYTGTVTIVAISSTVSSMVVCGVEDSYTALDKVSITSVTVYYDNCNTSDHESTCSGHTLSESDYAVTVDGSYDLTLHYGTDGWAEVTVTYAGVTYTKTVKVNKILIAVPEGGSFTYEEGKTYTVVDECQLKCFTYNEKPYGLSTDDYILTGTTSASAAGYYSVAIMLLNSDYGWGAYSEGSWTEYSSSLILVTWSIEDETAACGTGHSYEYSECNDNNSGECDGVHTGTCETCETATTTCGDENNAHIYGEWTKGSKISGTKLYEYTRTCSTCGHEDTCSNHEFGGAYYSNGTHYVTCEDCGYTTKYSNYQSSTSSYSATATSYSATTTSYSVTANAATATSYSVTANAATMSYSVTYSYAATASYSGTSALGTTGGGATASEGALPLNLSADFMTLADGNDESGENNEEETTTASVCVGDLVCTCSEDCSAEYPCPLCTAGVCDSCENCTECSCTTGDSTSTTNTCICGKCADDCEHCSADGNYACNWDGDSCDWCCDANEHSYKYIHENVETGDWTADEDGINHSYICSICGDVFKEAHHGGTATCTTKAVCVDCGESYGSELGHTLTYVSYKAPTCTDTGTEAYAYCTVCGDYFTVDENGGLAKVTAEEDPTISESYFEIPALEHQNVESVEGSHPTCTADGNLAYYYCPDCGTYFADESYTKAISDTSIITVPALGHSLVWAEDEENDGHYQKCNRNGCDYKNETVYAHTYEATECTSESECEGSHTVECEYCKATYTCGSEDNAHKYGEWTTTGETSTRKCTVCGHKVECAHESYVYSNCGSSCNGTHTGYCTTCGKTKECGNGDHSYPTDTYTYDSGRHYQKCETCGHINSAAHTWKTVTEGGDTEYTNNSDGTHYTMCTTCGYKVYSAHSWSAWSACSSNCGKTDCTDYVRSCSNCDATETCSHTDGDDSLFTGWSSNGSDSAADGHSRTCKVCGKVESGYHTSYNSGNAATCVSLAICDTCGVSYGEYADHDYGTEIAERPATCTEAGLKAHYYCHVCQTYFVSNGEGSYTPVDINELIRPANGHSLVWAVYTDNSTKHYQKCSVCGYSDNITYDHTYTATECNSSSCSDSHTVKCEYCEAEYTCGSEDNAHKYGEWNTGETSSTRKCEVCGHIDTCSSHSYDYSITTDGSKHIGTCSTCGYKTAAADHTLESGTWSDNEGWSDKDDGTHSRTCSTCGYTETKAHNYGSWNNGSRDCANCSATENCTHSGGTATCTKQAECVVCGESYGDLLDHDYDWTNGDKDGENKHWQECSVCGDKINENSHSYTEGSYTWDSGKHYQTCTDCGYVKETEHSLGDWTNSGNGYHYRECSTTGCGYSETAAHTSTSTNVATCTSAATCDDCEATYGSVLAHDYQETTQAATCYAEGSITYKCKNCGDSYEIPLAKTAHTVVTTTTYTKEATCEEGGYAVVESYCSECGAELDSETVPLPATGHNYVWKYNESSHWQECSKCKDMGTATEHTITYSGNSSGHTATCGICSYEVTSNHYFTATNTDGKSWDKADSATHTQTCADCGYIRYEAHSYSKDTTHNSDNGTIYSCEYCGETLEVEGEHGNVYTEEEVGKDATCTEDGYYKITIKCKDCDEELASTSEVTIPALGHNYVWQHDSEGNHWQYCTRCKGTTESASHTIYYTINGDGTHTAYCSICGYQADEAEACEYVYSADSSDSSKHVGICSYCGYTETAEHRFGNYIYDGDSHYLICADCGYVSDGEHSLSAWTDNQDGTHSRTCNDGCGYTVTAAHSGDGDTCSDCGASIGRTEGDDSTGGTTEGGDSTGGTTEGGDSTGGDSTGGDTTEGDDSVSRTILIWIAILLGIVMAGFIIAIIVLAYKRKAKEEDEE